MVKRQLEQGGQKEEEEEEAKEEEKTEDEVLVLLQSLMFLSAPLYLESLVRAVCLRSTCCFFSGRRLLEWFPYSALLFVSQWIHVRRQSMRLIGRISHVARLHDCLRIQR